MICSADALLGDSATLGLTQLIKNRQMDRKALGLSLQDIIGSASSALGARPEALKGLLIAQQNPLSFGELAQGYPVVARDKFHRALCATRYLRLLEALASYVNMWLSYSCHILMPSPL